MEKAFSRFREEAASFRTGRPTPALVEDVSVECYGAKMALREIATILVQPPNVLVIQPWDKTNLQPIERALMKAEIGASPAVDGDVVRIALPPLTEERRNELVRLLGKQAEETRIAFRLARDEARKAIMQLAADKKISEDEKFRGMERLQKEFDAFQKKLEDAVKEREKDIMTV
jgi:ribosome recycling factor